MGGIAGLALSVMLALLSRQPLGRSGLAGWVFGGQLGILAGSAVATVAATRRRGRSRHKICDGLGNGFHNIRPQFVVLCLVFLFKSEAFLLGHVGPAEVFDFLHDVEHDLLGAPVALIGGFAFAHISPGHVGGAIGGKGHAVRHLLPPALGVEPRVVPSLFAGIHMDPSLLLVRVDFGPYMVLGIPNPSDTAAQCTAEHAEAVGPLSDAASTGLQ